MAFDFELVYTLMGIVGGSYAAVQVCYSLWKKMTKKVEISYATGHLYFAGEHTLLSPDPPNVKEGIGLVVQSKDYPGSSEVLKTVRKKQQKQAKTRNRLINLKGRLHVGIINNKEENVCITDLLGTFIYNRKKHMEANLKKYGKPICFTLRPISRKPALPITLQPHEAIDLECLFALEEVYLSGLERTLPISHLPVYFQDGVPIVIFHEKKVEELWFSDPVSIRLSVHVNGKDLLHYGGSLAYKPADTKLRKEGIEIDDRAEDDEDYGTIENLKIREIEHKLCK